MTPSAVRGCDLDPMLRIFRDNAEHFIGQLDMYRIKPAYVIALRTLTALGAEPLTSLFRLLSVIPGVLLCLLCICLAFAQLQHVERRVNRRDFRRCRAPGRSQPSASARQSVCAHRLCSALCPCLQTLATTRRFLLVASICVRTNNILFAGLVLSGRAGAPSRRVPQSAVPLSCCSQAG